MSTHLRVTQTAILLSLLTASAVAQQGYITTVAGTGVAGTAGTGGPSLNAQLTEPTGIVIDSSLNVYIADTMNNRVVKVNGNTGILTLAAGNGVAASTGDGGPAVQASLNNPRGVAVDAAGNLYVVEFQGHRVRRIDAATGIITTVVGTGSPGFSGDGGPAVNASIGFAFSIAMSPRGNLFIADSGNARVRRVDAATGIITTVAGNGSSTPSPDGTLAVNAGLGAPIAVSVDIDDTMLIAEYTNARIRMVDPNTGALVTIAGNGSLTFTGDGGPATSAGIGKVAFNAVTDGHGGIYFPDGTGRIRRVDSAARTIVTIAGNGSGAQGWGNPCIGTVVGDNGPADSATLDGAFGIAFANGALFVTDALDCRVRRILIPSPNSYTNTTLSPSSTNINQGDALTLTATVSSIPVGGSPTGTVQFIDQPQNSPATLLGTATLSGGTASLTVTLMQSTVGHLIGAYYMGDPSFNGSGSAGVAITVGPPVSKPSPGISMSAPIYATLNVPTPISVTLTIPYGSTAQPTGSVVLYDNGVAMQTATVLNGFAQFSVSFTTLGSHAVTATYQGDSNYGPVTTMSYVTVKNASSVALSSSPNPSTQGTAVTYTATMTPPTATGYVEIHWDGNMLCIANITNGVAACTVSWLPAGTHSIQGFYQGDSALMGSTSTIITQTVKAATTTTVTSSAATSTYLQQVTFTATVSPASASGTVVFTDGATALGSAQLNGGSAAITIATLTGGVHSITAIYNGDGLNAGSTSAIFTQTVQPATLTLTLACSPNPSVVNQAVVCTGTLSSTTATGTMQFLDGSNAIGSGAVNNGAGSISLPSLTVGSHSITAVYSGDSNYAGVTSAPVTQVVGKANSTVAVASSPNPSTFGQAVTFTATISPAAATGSVQFLDGATVLGTAAVSGGSAALSISSLTADIHSITAVYSGDAVYAGSTSAALAQIVNKAATTVVSGSTLNPSTFTQSVGLTALVTPNSVTGTVQFLDGSTVLGTATLSGGNAFINTSALAAGTHPITVVYSGDGSYLGSTAPVLTQTVKQYPTVLTIASSPNPTGVGFAITFTASLTHITGSPTGTVQFLDGTTVLGTLPLNSLTASLTTSSLAAGTHTITAVYSGDANYSRSSASLSQSVWNPSSTSLTSDKTSTSYGQTITFTATVTPSTATGTVSFGDNGVFLAYVPIVGGQATLAIATLSAGTHTVDATYQGDAADAPSLTASRTVTVAQVKPTIAVTASPDPAQSGQVVTITATLSATTTTGTVTYKDGTQTIGTAPVSNGVAVFTTSALASGNHSITAVYSGDINYTSATSKQDILKVK